MKTFTMDYWKDGDWFVGRLREVPSVLSQASSVEGLKRSIADAYKLYHDTQGTTITNRKSQSIEVMI